jgi:hypothetical protein
MKTTVVNITNIHRRDYDVYIGRPSKWGNPFKIGKNVSGVQWTRDDVIEIYRNWVETKHPEIIEKAKRELRGKRLGCYCSPLPCHGDVLAEFADMDS